MYYQELEQIFRFHGFEDFRWIKASDIVVAQWVRMKCAYGCRSYGKKGTCPPNSPPLEECRAFFGEYEDAVLFHIPGTLADPDKRDQWSREINDRLLKVERDVFLKDYRKAFLLFMDECQICLSCPGIRQECLHLDGARPCPEALGVDVFATVRKYGFPIKVLTHYQEEMNRYAFLMVD